MRPTLLVLLALTAPATAQVTTMDECIATLETDPAAAREAAARWHRLGGGAPARTCEAFALDALGATRAAAELLTDLAQSPNVALSGAQRAILFDTATDRWTSLGEAKLAQLTARAAAQADPTPTRALASARLDAAIGDTAAAIKTLTTLKTDDPILKAQAQILLQTLQPPLVAPRPRPRRP